MIAARRRNKADLKKTRKVSRFENGFFLRPSRYLPDLLPMADFGNSPPRAPTGKSERSNPSGNTPDKAPPKKVLCVPHKALCLGYRAVPYPIEVHSTHVASTQTDIYCPPTVLQFLSGTIQPSMRFCSYFPVN